MENEIDDFINYDDKFVFQPRFYSKLLILSCTTSNSVEEALSTEYLRNVSDVNDIFQDSMMTCLELPLQITDFMNKKTQNRAKWSQRPNEHERTFGENFCKIGKPKGKPIARSLGKE